MKHKLLSLFVALICASSVFAYDCVIDGIYYNLNTQEKTAEVTHKMGDWGANSYSGSVVIPETVTYDNVAYSVTTIGDEAFFECNGLISVTIPYSVTTIGDDAFYGCSSLTSITIPNSVTTIGENAFCNCSGLTSVTIPYSVTTIGSYAFVNCSNLTSITIPKSVISIGTGAFTACTSLVSIIIPNSVTTIGFWPFSACSSLTSIIVESDNAVYDNRGNCNAIIETTTNTLIQGCSNATIPNSVTTIGDGAFYGCHGLTSIPIPNSVTTIGDDAFYGCTGLTSVTIPNSVTTIGESAFNGCKGLTSVTIGNSVTTIGEAAFSSCSNIKSVTWNAKNCNGSTYGGSRGWQSIFSDHVETFKVETFIFGNSVEVIPSYICKGMNNLTAITIPNSVTTIGFWAFSECHCDIFLEAITPPVLEDGDVFYGNNIYVPCGTKEVYQTAWQGYASRIKYAPYPSYVITKKSENGTIKTTTTDFTICDEPLVKCTANPDRGCFFVRWADGNTDNPRTIELTQDTTLEAIFDYQLTGKCGKDSALTWTLDKSTMALNITGTGALSENYTYGTFIESLTINNEITSIGQEAFEGCKNLKNVIIGSSVKVLEEYAFYGCSTIKTITCYSQRPPTVNNYALYGLDYGTIVYVPADYLNTYKMHDAWGLYDVQPIGAKNVETTEVTTSTTSNNVTITWPITDGTDTYTLTITKNGETVCVLTFNANGQLTNIAFAAPGHNGAHQAPAATLTAQGYQFTVTGLNPGTAYDYSVTATDAGGQTLAEHKGNFSTTGGTGFESVHGSQPTMHKVLRNGQILLERNNATYTLMGQKVK